MASKKKKSHEIRSLTRLFICKTFKFFCWSDEKISGQQDRYYTDIIEDCFKSIIAQLKEKSNPDLKTADGFERCWARFLKAGKLQEKAEKLEEVKAFLDKKAKGTIQESTKDKVIRFYDHEWMQILDGLQSGLSVANIKILKDCTIPKDIKLDTKLMIIDSVLIPYFESSQDLMAGEFNRFKRTFDSVDSFLCYEDARFALYEKAAEQLMDSVKELKKLDFEAQKFRKYLLNLFSIFDDLCAKNEKRLAEKTMTEQQSKFLNEIKLFLEGEVHMTPDTCGLEQTEIDEKYMVASSKALADMIFITGQKRITLKQCIAHKGFQALIRYYMSLEMMKVSNNDYAELIVKYLADKSFEESRTLIDENVEIVGPLWMGNHCSLKNCRIEQEVIIEDDVIIDADAALKWGKILIGAKSVVKKGTELTVGANYVTPVLNDATKGGYQ